MEPVGIEQDQCQGIVLFQLIRKIRVLQGSLRISKLLLLESFHPVIFPLKQHQETVPSALSI